LRRPQLRPPSATTSGGLNAPGHDSQHRNYASGPFASDLARPDTPNSLNAIERTDSMVMHASAWARAILSSNHPLPPTSPTAPASNHSSIKPWDTVSIPVKQAVVIMQPDGETSLGISEVKQKDVMVQVDEDDLIRETNNRGGGFNGSSTSGIIRTSSGAAITDERMQQRRDSVDEASQCPGQTENSTSQRGRASASHEDLSNVRDRSSSSSITATGQVAIGEDSTLDVVVSIPPEIEDGSSSVPVEQQDQQQDDRHRRRRRRRKRRKGTSEASCQTEESSLS